MKMTTVDGVPVFHAEGPVPFAAGLVFRVGRRHESFVKGGLTHLVEHLTMRAVGRMPVECNASVEVGVTEFTATGSPARVVEFLRRVCAALSDPPTDDLRVEADVLRAEESVVTHPVVGALCAEIYGMAGVGLVGQVEPALRSLTAEDVRAWASRYFTRANAAVWITGPVPDDLALPLPDGESVAPVSQRVQSLDTPAWMPVPEGSVGLAAHIRWTPALGATLRILRDRVEDQLRHRRGLSYTVDADQIVLDRDYRLAHLVADVRDGQETVALRTLWATLRELADDGPTEAELIQDRTAVAEYLDGPAAIADEVRVFATAHVAGIPCPSSADLRAASLAMTAADVREVAHSVRAAAVLGSCEELDSSLPGVSSVPTWSEDVVAGTVFRRRMLSSAPRGSQLILGDDGVSVELGDGGRLTVRYAETIGLVEEQSGEYMLVGSDGFTIPISRKDWRDGATVVNAVRAAVPSELQVRADPEDGEALPGPAAILLRAAEHQGREALWPTGRDHWFLPGEQWCVVVPVADGIENLAATAGSASAQLGRKRPVLVLTRSHDGVTCAMLRNGRERDRHVWESPAGAAERTDDNPGGDPDALADALDRPDLSPLLAKLLSTRAEPEDVVQQVVRTLELPDQVRRLLEGDRPDTLGFELVPARTFAEGMRASIRGEFDRRSEREATH